MKIFLGADHRGFKMKDKVMKWLKDWNYEYTDLGAYQENPIDDYTEFAEKVGKEVGKDTTARGILMCGSGMGVDIVANKIDGVRAGIGISEEQVKAGRNDDDINVLVVASDFTTDKEVQDMTRSFLQTSFEGAERFERRLNQIKEIEQKN